MIQRNIKYLILLVAVTFSCRSHAQEIVTIDFANNISKFVGQVVLGQSGIDVTLDTGVDLYRVTYTTIGSDMRLDTASGLLMMPDIIDKNLPILVYQHGTTDGRTDVPSNQLGGYIFGAIFAGKGMIVLAPDFLGLGTSRGIHPYVHAETEATAALDMLSSIRPFLEQNEIGWNEQLFVTGYSQGGHAAMAFHKYVQEEVPDEYQVVASLPMSGPYSISKVMRNIAFSDEPFSFPSYLVYSTVGIRAIYPELYEKESDIFRAPYLNAINEFLETGDGLSNMNESLVQTMVAENGQSIPKHLFKDSILNILENNESHLFNTALAESDVFDWAPEVPVLMLYCEADDQVPFRNSIIADSVMNANGAENVTSMDVSGGRMRDHLDCIVPALNVGIPWLLSFIDQSTPTIDLVTDESLQIFPNPTFGNLNITSGEIIERVEIYNFNGQLVLSEAVKSNSTHLSVNGLVPGIYLTHVFSPEGLSIHKLVVQQ